VGELVFRADVEGAFEESEVLAGGGFVVVRVEDGFEFEEGAEVGDVVEVDADVLIEEEFAAFGDDAAKA
jgi:acyl-CoA hydrolase